MLADQPIRQFLEALASDSPTPGGGGAAALCGALGAALVAMTANLTVGRKNYQDVDAEMRALAARADALREQLTALIDADAAAFDQVSAAYKLPRATDEEKQHRSDAIQRALKAASDPPLRMVEAARQVLELSVPAAQRGNSNVVSDAAVAAYLALAAMQSARLNVEINLRSIKDELFVRSSRERLAAAFAGAADLVATAERAFEERR
ncbi:MAG: cyclodeaminase/cyclohydrolase family protein [Chloroflexota bacterium]|nr:cyclodeaminase/cyclohydrolase family protein [Dehalococcoidia bacterium]MDW8254485.1 cyclodeaminase/cyclohydrolase family protein [Chloroflexota bacterium]